MIVEIFRFKGINLKIYKINGKYTVNKMTFYNNIELLKEAYKKAINNMRNVRKYG